MYRGKREQSLLARKPSTARYLILVWNVIENSLKVARMLEQKKEKFYDSEVTARGDTQQRRMCSTRRRAEIQDPLIDVSLLPREIL